MRIGLWATTLAAAAALAGTAQAGDAACLWNGVTLNSRDAFFVAYEAQGPEALNERTFSEDELTASLARCGVTDERVGIVAGEALGGYAIELAATHVLKKTRGLTAGDLDAAWAGLEPEQRVSVRQWMLKDIAGEEVEPDMVTMTALLKALHLDLSEPAAQHAVAYYAGRILREDRERKF